MCVESISGIEWVCSTKKVSGFLTVAEVTRQNLDRMFQLQTSYTCLPILASECLAMFCHTFCHHHITIMTTLPPTNSLGLDFDVQEEPSQSTCIAQDSENTESQQVPQSPTTEQQPRGKKTPYVNPDRVKTGGPQRVRLIRLTS